VERIPLWIDCDTGIDDALALLLATATPEAQLLGVSTVAGNCSLEDATANTLGVLALADANDIPVHAGASQPLAEPLHLAPSIHGTDGLGGLRPMLPALRRRATSLSAVEAVRRACHEHARHLVLVATGPLTNLALAVASDRALVEMVSRVVVMGGAVRVPGNVGPNAEFNIATDPEAARIVLTAGWPLTLVPLDVTMRVRMGAKDTATLRKQGPAAAFCADALAFYQEAYRPELGMRAAPMHDPLAVAVALDPRLVATEDLPLSVETSFAYEVLLACLSV
jgi:purine nucleosidase